MSFLRSKWIFAVLPILVVTPARAQFAPRLRPPSSRTYFAARPRPFEEARLATKSAAAKRPYPATSAAPATPVEIVELAQSLKNDPDLIYQFVHDNIQFTPMWGYLKGPLGTLLDGNGDSFDQSALMVALLTQAALSNPAISNPGFLFGALNLSSAQAQNWLGVDANPNSIAALLASAGIPADTDGSGNVLAMGHVWVQVSINGTAYVFDPAFKTQTWKSGVVSNLPAIMGYSQAAFLTAGGGTVTPTSIQGVNRTALRNQLATYSTNVLNYVRQNLPTGGLSDFIGGSSIVPTAVVNGQTIRQTSNPNQAYSPSLWGPTIDPDYAAQFTVAFLGTSPDNQNPPNVTFNSADVYGRRLSIFFNSNLAPVLYLDGAPQLTGTPVQNESPFYVGEQISVPFLPSGSTQTYQIIQAGTNANGGSTGYVFSIGWGQTGRGMVEKHRYLLTQAINSGAAANSEAALGEGLAMIGYEWLAEVSAQQQIADQLLGTTTMSYYAGGITGEQVGSGISSPYVDLPLSYVSTPSRFNGTGQEGANSEAAYLNNSDVGSAFESSILEQTQFGVSLTAASTVKILDLALENNDTIFDIDNDGTQTSQNYYTNTIRPLLAQYYQAYDLQYVDYYVYNGYRVIAPLHGEISFGAWEGIGLKALSTEYGYAELIEGGLSEKAGPHKTNGGQGGTNCPPTVLIRGADGTLRPISRAKYLQIWGPPGGNGPTIAEPIDTRKGAFVNKPEDLKAGAGMFPYGLAFQRSYDSNAQGSLGPLGYGWNHNFNITAAIGSDAFAGMGHSSLLSAAGSIVALYVSSDLVSGQLLQGQANLQQFTYESIVSKWFTDQLTTNVVYFNQGWDTQEFTGLADGTYAPEPGSAAILDATSGAFRLRTKEGETMNFGASGQISSWSNAAGATVSFGYAGGVLTTVSNGATGHQLTLGYSGGLLSSVTDGTRTVSYSYTNNTLTAFTDALQQNTTYSYDTSGQYDTAGHLTQIFYPSHPANAFVTTAYDIAGKVTQQADANGNVTHTYFAGTRSESDDAEGNSQVWYFDPLTNMTLRIQDYGPSPHLNITNIYTYDAQQDLLTATMPEGNNTVYTYDSLFNPLTITNNPKPGSPLAPLVQTFTYRIPVASLPNYEEVSTATDPEGNVTTNSYSASTGTLSSTVQPAVAKPGAATSSPTWAFTYTAIGLRQTITDPEGRITHFAYDPTFGDELTNVTVDYGRLNLSSSFTYDAMGNIATVTDANGHTTTNTHDSLRRLVEVDRALAGVVTKYTYYPDGQIQTLARELTSGTFETTSYSYTLEDQLSTITDPLGNTVMATYDADDRRQTVTAQVSATQNRQRTYTYDSLSRLYQVSDTTAAPGTVLETHAYSPNSNEIAFTDANSNQTTYTYDGFDRLMQTTYPDRTAEQYAYNPDGAVLQKAARSGQTITYTYDALNRRMSKTPAGESAGEVTYGYDYLGRLLQAADATSANPYQIGYDTAGRVISYTDQEGRSMQAQYDAVGNRTRLQWPAGSNGPASYSVTYAYDALNRMTEIDANGSSSTPLAKYQWDALSRRTLITYGDGTTDSYTQYDAGDNLLALTESFTGGSSVTFQYGWFKNHQRQTTAVNNSSFQYLPAAVGLNYAPADVDNGYTSVNSATFTYDGNHNLTYDGVNALSYDVENRLIEAQNALSGSSQYFYDPLSHRRQKTVNGVTTQFVLAGDDEVADYSGTGAGTAQVLTVRGVGGSAVASVTASNGAVAYYHLDGLGSTVALTQPGTSGAAESFTYSEFGVPAGGGGTGYLFAGYRYDAETGLYYVRARYYSPELGRFLQTDPIGIGGGRNLYAYVNNDPINRTDRSGTTPDHPQVLLASMDPLSVGLTGAAAYGLAQKSGVAQSAAGSGAAQTGTAQVETFEKSAELEQEAAQISNGSKITEVQEAVQTGNNLARASEAETLLAEGTTVAEGSTALTAGEVVLAVAGGAVVALVIVGVAYWVLH